MPLFRSVVALSALSLIVSASPALAQHRGGGGSRSGGSRSSGGAHAQAAPRTAAPSGGVARSYNGGRVAAAPSRTYGYATPRGYSARGYYGGRAFYGGGFGYIAPTRFISPYYAFRPRFSLGFGLFAGYPIAYSYPFYNPYYYGYPYAYDPYYDYGYGYNYPSYGAYPSYPQTYGNTYPAPGGNGYVQSNFPPAGSSNGSVQAQPQQQPPSNQNMGGVSFEITPNDAKIYVDGIEMGTVGQFTPTSQPLGIDAGRHKIEIRAPGYKTITFDADIVAGQVIPYQGQMLR